jgi:hypothetical protein
MGSMVFSPYLLIILLLPTVPNPQETHLALPHVSMKQCMFYVCTLASAADPVNNQTAPWVTYRYALTNFPACFIYVSGLDDQRYGVLQLASYRTTILRCQRVLKSSFGNVI